MKMDGARNEIILVNLKMTLASLCLMICVVSAIIVEASFLFFSRFV